MTVRIILSRDELQALEKFAWHERRRVGVQAALIVRRELERVGLLPTDTPTPTVDGWSRAIGGNNGDQ